MARNKQVSFYGQGQQLGGNTLRRDYQSDPRRMMEQHLMAQGGKMSPVQSPMEGIARALSGAAGGYFAGQGRRDLAAKEAAQSEEMKRIFAGLQGTPKPPPAQVSGADYEGEGYEGFDGFNPTTTTGGGIPGALAAGQGATSPGAQGLMQQLMIQQYQREQDDFQAGQARERDAVALNEGRTYDRGVAATEREQAVDDREYDQAARLALEQGKPDKYGNGWTGADPASQTGFSRYQVNADGDIRNLGPVAAPRAMFNENEARDAALSTRYEAATESLREADSIMVDVNQMLELVGRVDSGTFKETKMEIAGAMKSLGFEIDEAGLADAQAMRAKAMDFILKRISQTKGAISDKEMIAFKRASASLANTADGNRMILALASRVAERQIFVAQAVREGYGAKGMTRKKLDDLEIEARAQWDKANGGLTGNPQPSEADILETMRVHGLTREEVLERLNDR